MILSLSREDRVQMARALEEAVLLFSRPNAWTRHVLAAAAPVDEDPLESPLISPVHMSPSDPLATCWCAQGALSRVLGVDEGRKGRTLLYLEIMEAFGEVHGVELAHYNDQVARHSRDVVDRFVELRDRLVPEETRP